MVLSRGYFLHWCDAVVSLEVAIDVHNRILESDEYYNWAVIDNIDLNDGNQTICEGHP